MLSKKNNLKITVDYLHGAGIGYIDSYLNDSARVLTINDVRNPLFNKVNPDPNKKNARLLKQKVVSTGADIGIALDGDADRFGIVDNEGNFYTPNQIFTLLLPYFLESRNFTGPVYRSVATTHQLDKIASDYGIPIVETPVGFKHIADGFLNDNAFFGVEESGGMSIKGHVPEKDGVLGSMLVVEMLAQRKKSLHELWEENCRKYGRFYNERIDVSVTTEKKSKIVDFVKNYNKNKINDLDIKETVDIDGKKFIFDNESWCLIRPSGTENVIRIYLEAFDQGHFRKTKQEILKWLEI